MSRTSADRFDTEGRLLDGFDYDNQAWVADGHYLNCGHILRDCGCYGREHIGEPTVAPAKREVTHYEVHIEKTETRALWVDVDASSENEAKAKAIERCRQHKEFFRGDVYDTQFKPVGIEERSGE